uniref:Orofacial cleft 1 candidate gene 1 protein homolog n=1 Tax=Callorhinchus milii TaxID=7868 RepID=A0A4W3J2J3_CALMI|eukprot:gi/632965846/ref/XP_007899093.1/ PREDICTED: orofacial cleft 1 candidate gene 1 protein homolog [Callorhinchus milii]
MEEESNYEQKLQQKARNQAKQKKSKSAEFLMVKDERAAAEGIENPAFNISTRNLSIYHSSAEKEIRHDRHDGTLTAHQQKLLLQTHDQARGNEYCRNYFDLQMYEGIDPRQYGIEVGTEDECELSPDKNNEMDLYLQLLKVLEDDSIPETTGAIVGHKNTEFHSNISGLRQKVESEMIPPYVEQFEESVQDDMILVGSLSLEQVRVKI